MAFKLEKMFFFPSCASLLRGGISFFACVSASPVPLVVNTEYCSTLNPEEPEIKWMPESF